MTTDGDNSATRPAPPKRGRWRRRLILAAVVLAVIAIWPGRWAYRRCTLKPEPRPEYWLAQYAALFPVAEDALPPSAYMPILTAAPPLRAGFMREGLIGPDLQIPPEDLEQLLPAYERLHNALLEDWDIQPGLDEGEILRCNYWRSWMRTYAEKLLTSGETERGIEVCLDLLRLGEKAQRFHPQVGLPCKLRFQYGAFRIIRLHASRIGSAIDGDRLMAEIESILGPPPTPEELMAVERIQLNMAIEPLFVREGGWIDVPSLARMARDSGIMVIPSPMNLTNPNVSTSQAWNLTSFLWPDLDTMRARIDSLVTDDENGGSYGTAPASDLWPWGPGGSGEFDFDEMHYLQCYHRHEQQEVTRLREEANRALCGTRRQVTP